MPGHPSGHRPQAAVQVAGHDQVADEELRPLRHQAQVSRHDLEIAVDAGQTLGAVVAAELEVGELHRNHAVQQLEDLGGHVHVGVENKR